MNWFGPEVPQHGGLAVASSRTPDPKLMLSLLRHSGRLPMDMRIPPLKTKSTSRPTGPLGHPRTRAPPTAPG